MLRKLIPVVIALLVVVGLVWRYAREEEATTPLPASAARGAPAAAKMETEEPTRLPAERVEIHEKEKELQVESPAPGTPRGSLDDAVPRPILDGHVWIRMSQSGSEGEPSTERDFEAPVRADGTFELAEVPPGRGQVLALCRGWVSRRTPFDAIEAVTLRLGRQPTFGEIEQAFQEEGPETLAAQRIVLPARGPLVVAMERTGSLAVIVRKQDGSPLAGATVTTSPNVRWIGGDSSIFPWRDWKGTTDALGRARIDDLPPDDSLSVDAHHDLFQMARADRDRVPSVAIVSGMTAELALALEPKAD